MALAVPSRTALVRRARRINRELARLYPDARIELNFTSALELLVAAILSAQNTERNTNEVSRVLFAQYPTAADYASAQPAELEKLIQTTGYYRAKARTLIALGGALCARFGGEVPSTLDELVTLPGVGRKTANMVLGGAFGVPGIVVDTHVARLARRFGWTAQTGPDKIERDVAALLPRAEWTAGVEPDDLARPPGLSRPQARLRRVRDRALVPVVRPRPDRSGDRPQAGQDRAVFLTGPNRTWPGRRRPGAAPPSASAGGSFPVQATCWSGRTRMKRCW